MAAVAITTKDNPFSPFDQFSEWYNYDHAKGYNTCEWLARLSPSPDTDSVPDSFLDAYNEIVIDRIIRLRPDIYIKVTQETA